MSPINDQTFIHPLVFFVMLSAGSLILCLPRKYAIIPFLFAAILIPVQQRLVIMGLDFYSFRLLLLFVIIRIIKKGEYRNFQLNTLDILFFAWAFASIITYTLLCKSAGALANVTGQTFDALGLYLLARIWLQNIEEIHIAIRSLLSLAIVLGAILALEYVYNKNLFMFLAVFRNIAWI
ncbi:MAG: hypothetical protein R3C41_16330 [Calditrichia bacterium]